MTPVSASMIVRDEEAGLERALGSLRAVEAIDEVVIVDTGSTDRTIEIARDLGAVVHQQPWQDDFAFHRNHCLELCSHDWVFVLDGDEVLVDARAYRRAPPAVGDVVVIQHPHQGDVVAIKRVAELRDGALWLLGDNPAGSSDSRTYGAVPLSRLRGRVVRVLPD